MIPLAEAKQRVRAACGRLDEASCAVDDALGLVLAEDVVAREDVPPFANTAMDGFALRAADTVGAPVRLRVVGELPAGRDPAGLAVGACEAVRIMTGAPIPAGADAIVMVELTRDERDGEVEVTVEVPPGNHVRAAGEDLVRGATVFPAGTVLRPGHLGVLAVAGRASVRVVRRARVGVLSTGDELVDDPGVDLRPGQIRDANRHALLACVREAGAEAVDLGIVGDDEVAVRKAVDEGLASCDALITSGGVSMGDHDPVKVVLRELGGDHTWMQVAIRPAKPLSFAVAGDPPRPVFGLPGNPASSMVSFELFARPALLAMMGRADVERPRTHAVAADGFPRTPDGKLHLVRVVLRREGDSVVAVSAGGQGSNLLTSMALADGFALVPDGKGIPAGDGVEVMLLR